jgi:hypothetical protein
MRFLKNKGKKEIIFNFQVGNITKKSNRSK